MVAKKYFLLLSWKSPSQVGTPLISSEPSGDQSEREIEATNQMHNYPMTLSILTASHLTNEPGGVTSRTGSELIVSGFFFI